MDYAGIIHTIGVGGRGTEGRAMGAKPFTEETSLSEYMLTLLLNTQIDLTCYRMFCSIEYNTHNVRCYRIFFSYKS